MSRYAPMVGVLLGAVLCSACGTSQAPQRLAERTAANVGIVGAHLKRLAHDGSELADLRATNVSTLHAANAKRRAAYNYDLALTRHAGGDANLDLIPQLEAWGKEVDAIFKAADGAEKERKAAVLGTQTQLDTKAEALGQIAEALAALAKTDSVRSRARFLATYAGQLRKEIDERLEKDDKSATEAKHLLSDVKDRMTSVDK